MDYGKGQGPGKEGGGFNFGGRDPTQMSGSLYRSPTGGTGGKGGSEPGMGAAPQPPRPHVGVGPHVPTEQPSLAEQRAAAAQRFEGAGGMEGLGFAPSGSNAMALNRANRAHEVMSTDSTVTTDSSSITRPYRDPADLGWRRYTAGNRPGAPITHVASDRAGGMKSIDELPPSMQRRIRQNLAAGASPSDPRIMYAPVNLYRQGPAR